MYKLPTLLYSKEELEPFIDTHTMGLHYHKHHQNYLNKLNELLINNDYDYRFSLTELLFRIDNFPKKDQENILFNLGGVLNHNLYWKSMNPKRQKPFGNLMKQINKTYGSHEMFWDEFKQKALSLKGSGYTFLVLKENKDLDIINTKNQDTPLFLGYIPLFTIDLWEHAYYLNYENDKAKYIDNFADIADFTYASNLYNNITN